MQNNIVSFPNAENRFYRIVDRLETLATQHPTLTGEARSIVRELENFVMAIDRQLEVAYDAMTRTRTSESRAAAWSEAVHTTLNPDTLRAVQHRYEQIVTAI